MSVPRLLFGSITIPDVPQIVLQRHGHKAYHGVHLISVDDDTLVERELLRSECFRHVKSDAVKNRG